MTKKILLLPGLGDVHWVFLKLESWLKKQGPQWVMPEIWIWDIDNRPRTLEYLKHVPWVSAGSYYKLPLVGRDKLIFDSLYLYKGSKDYVRNFHGFDVLIGMNGNMRNGVPFAELLEGAKINFDYGPCDIPENYGGHQATLGSYFVLAFSGFGMFEKAWCKELTAQKLRTLVATLKEQFPAHRFIYTGLAWDDKFTRELVTEQDSVLVNRTSLGQFLSLLKFSSGYVGWCGGNSIIAQHLGVPTVVWWSSKYFPHHDRVGWETPLLGESMQLVLEVEDYHHEKTPFYITTFLRGS